MIQRPLVVKQETKGTILDGRADQALPETAPLRIRRIGDEEVVCMLGRAVRQPKVVLNELVVIQLTFCILDIREPDGFIRPKRNNCQGQNRSQVSWRNPQGRQG
jgi:hypothetical protein